MSLFFNIVYQGLNFSCSQRTLIRNLHHSPTFSYRSNTAELCRLNTKHRRRQRQLKTPSTQICLELFPKKQDASHSAPRSRRRSVVNGCRFAAEVRTRTLAHTR